MSSKESKTKVEVKSVPEEEFPDGMTREEFAAKVMDVVHDGILGKNEKRRFSRHGCRSEERGDEAGG